MLLCQSRGSWIPAHVVTKQSLGEEWIVITLLSSNSSPLSYFLFTTHDSAIEEISETALIQPSLELGVAHCTDMFFGFTVGQITAHTDWIIHGRKKKLTSKVPKSIRKTNDELHLRFISISTKVVDGDRKRFCGRHFHFRLIHVQRARQDRMKGIQNVPST